MKRSLLLFITLFVFTISGVAQNANAIFFSDDGQGFYVILNGLRQNDKPETNIKITDLAPTRYLVKIIFANENLGELDKSIYLNAGMETTFQIKKKESTPVEDLNKATDKIGHKLGVAVGNSKEGDYKEPEGTVYYILKGFSELPIDKGPQPIASSSNSSRYSNSQAVVSNKATTTETTTTTTTTTTSPTDGTSTNVNIDVQAEGASGSVSISATDNYSETHQEQTTITTTTIGTEVETTEDHYVMPGYSGPIGCNWPMSDADFASAKKTISSKAFEDSKLTIAKQVINNNCLTSSQVHDILTLFDFEDTKLDFAKYAYGYTYDLGNYYKVNDAFEFESSIEELNQYIGGR